MAELNFKYMASSLAIAAKSIVYPLRGTVEPTVSRDGAFTESPASYPLVSSVYGQNVLMPLIIRTASGKTLRLDEAVINLVKRKQIVSTSIVGGNGTVKELISDNDVELTITTAIVAVDDNGCISDDYPFEGVKQLREILDLPERIEIVSDFLEVFDIDGGAFAIVVTDYELEQETHTNRQTVRISALSDSEYTIFYEEN